MKLTKKMLEIIDNLGHSFSIFQLMTVNHKMDRKGLEHFKTVYDINSAIRLFSVSTRTYEVLLLMETNNDIQP